MALQHLRSGTANKRPIPTVMSAGQIAINTNEASPGLFFKDSNGDLVKVGPVHIGTSAPNSSPDSVAATALVTGTVYQILTVGTSDFTLVGASANTVGVIFTATGTTTGDGTVSGQQGVEKGEQWLDTTGGNYVLKIYDGTAWRSEAGEFVNVSGDTMTGALLLDNAASASAPDLSFDGDANTGIYSPGADQLALATNGTGRLFVASNGHVGINEASPEDELHITQAGNSQITIENTSSSCKGFISAGSNFGVGSISNDRFDIFTNNALCATFDSSGRLGVGTSSPDGELDVTGTGDANGGVVVINDAGSIGLEVVSSSPTFLFNETDTTDENYQIRLESGDLLLQTQTDARTSASTKVTFDSSGRVGIGTTQVDSKLVVAGNNDGGGNQNTLRFVDLDTATINGQSMGRIEWYTSDTDEAGVKAYIEATTYVDARGGTLTLGTDGSASGAQNIVFKQKTNEVGRFDTSGRLLVGTSSAYDTYTNIQVKSTASVAPGTLDLQASFNSTSPDQSIGWIRFFDSNNAYRAQISCVTDGASSSSADAPGRLVFSVTADGASSPTERMRVQADGNVRIGNASTLYPATDNSISVGISGNRWSAIWAANGTIQTSDQRTKTDVAPAALGTDFIKALRPVSYKWIEGGQVDSGKRDDDGNYIYESVPGKRTHWGFIAQEVKQAVDAAGVDFGGWVLTDKDDPDSQQALRYDQFIAPLTKALQEALAEIDVLKAKVAALEAS
jgi:hypothetical protein